MSLRLSTTLLTLSSMIFLVTGYLINIWLGRILGPYEYGTFGILTSVISLVNLLQSTGIPMSLSKKLSEDNQLKKQYLSSAILLQVTFSFLLSLIFIIFANYFSQIFKDQSLTSLFYISAFSFPIFGLSTVLSGYYNGLKDFKFQTLNNSIYFIAKLLFILILTYYYGLIGAIWGFILAPLPTILISLKIIRIHFPINSFKSLVILSIPFMLSALFINLQSTLDIFFLKSFFPSSNLPGFYVANQNISRIPFYALNAFSIILFPSISKNVSLNLHQHSRDLIHNALRIILILLVPGTLLIAATSSKIIELFYSQSYILASSSLSILIVGIGFLTIFNVLINILNGTGALKHTLVISLFGVILTTILCWVLIPKYNLDGAAFSTTIGAFVITIISAYFVYQKFQALVSIIRIIKILFASFIIYGIAQIISFPILFLPFIYIILFIIYFILLIIFKELTKKDLQQFQEILPAWLPGYSFIKSL